MTLTASEQKLLTAIRENPFASQREYADKIQLSRSATANLISKLTNEGYILGKPYLLSEENRVLCVGGANIDRKYFLSDIPIIGTSNRVTEASSYGGVARNIAENLGRLGISCAMMTICGKDIEGDGLIQDLSNYVDTTSIRQVTDYKTSAYIATMSKDNDLYMGLASMSICDLMDAQWIHDNQRHILSSNYIVCDLNVCQSAVSALKMLCQSRGIPLVIVGVSVPKMDNLPEDITGISLGIFNIDESKAYFNTNQDDVTALANMWLEAGLSKVIVTDGGDVFAYAAEGTVHLGYPGTVQIVDVTGAGDAFSAGVVYGLFRGESFETAVAIGGRNAALTLETSDSVRKDLNSSMLYHDNERTKN